jgi:hypothetical protein
MSGMRSRCRGEGEKGRSGIFTTLHGKFKESGILGIKTEAEKMLMLAALNLVECIAEIAPRRTK